VLKGPRAAVFPSRGDYKVKISEPLAAQGFQVFEVFFQVCACYTNYNIQFCPALTKIQLTFAEESAMV
jgi:hypothetical protein